MSDIAALFARDPRKHTDEDITKIIEKFREARHQFNMAGGKAPAKKTKTETEVVTRLKLDIDLDL